MTLMLFTVIVDNIAAGRWQELIKCVVAWLPETLKINVPVLGEDFGLLAGRKAEEWVEELHLKEGGGALIRSDQHILKGGKVVATTEVVLFQFWWSIWDCEGGGTWESVTYRIAVATKQKCHVRKGG
jgi:hypothetical protein